MEKQAQNNIDTDMIEPKEEIIEDLDLTDENCEDNKNLIVIKLEELSDPLRQSEEEGNGHTIKPIKTELTLSKEINAIRRQQEASGETSVKDELTPRADIKMSSSEPNKKIKKPVTKKKYTDEAIKKALYAIRNEKQSIRKVCQLYGIPKSTLLDRLKGRFPDKILKTGPPPVLGEEGEKKLIEWLINISKCGFPIKKNEVCDSVKKIIQDGKIKNSFKNDCPGIKWFNNFLQRNKEMSLKSAESVNKARANVTEESIRLWFKELESYLAHIGQKDLLNHPERIFNGDESCFSLCPKTGKVLGPRRYRNLIEIKRSNEIENITVLIMFNAKGDICPPCVMLPYIRPPRAVLDSMPPEWCLGKSESGWMSGDVFYEYITNQFNKWVEEKNIKKPVLILVDGHKSHLSLHLSTVCEKLQIILYALPPNTTHILQPADVSVFAPLKKYWRNTVREFLMKPENANCAITKTNFCVLLKEILNKHSMAENIQNGFKCCGLYPFDPSALDYAKCASENLLSKEINHSDIVSTKKVLEKLKPTLKNKNINMQVIMKELDILKKSISMEVGNITETSMESESENNESYLNNLSDSKENITQNYTRPIDCNMLR